MCDSAGAMARVAGQREARRMGPEGAMFGPYRVLRRLGGGVAGEVHLPESTKTPPSPPPPPAGPHPIPPQVLPPTAPEPNAPGNANKGPSAGATPPTAH